MRGEAGPLTAEIIVARFRIRRRTDRIGKKQSALAIARRAILPVSRALYFDYDGKPESAREGHAICGVDLANLHNFFKNNVWHYFI
jgi:hypothetical protein